MLLSLSYQVLLVASQSDSALLSLKGASEAMMLFAKGMATPPPKESSASARDMMKALGKWGTKEIKDWAMASAQLTEAIATRFADTCRNGITMAVLAQRAQDAGKCDSTTFPTRFNEILAESDRDQLWIALKFFELPREGSATA